MRFRSALVLCACVGALTLVAPLANADQGYTDAAGDATGAVDIGSVQVTNDSFGNVTFTIALPAATPLLTDSQVIELDIDTDQKSSTGDEYGSEVSLEIYGADNTVSWDYGKWNGTKMDYDARSATGGLRTTATSASITIHRSELNDAQTFDFALYSVQFTADAITGSDSAPDENTDWWTYSLETKKLSVKLSTTYGKFPVAGGTWKISSTAWGTPAGGDARQIGTGTVQCVAQIGKTHLKATGAFTGGIAQCTVKIPKKTSGKVVRGTIAVSVSGGQATISFAKKIL